MWVSDHGAAAGDGAGDGRRPLSVQRALGGGAEEWAAAGGGGEGARRVGREGAGRAGAAAVATAGTTASTIDRPVSRADSHVSSCAAKAAVATVAAAAPSASGEREDGFTRGGDRRGRRGAARHGHPQTLALGADGVAVGKPYLYGLCAGGEAGARQGDGRVTGGVGARDGVAGVGTVGELRERMARGEALVRRHDTSVETFRTGAREEGIRRGIF